VPGYREIIDLSPADDSRFLADVGQSGHPLSAHYDDFLTDWKAVKHRRMQRERADIERGKTGTLRLQGIFPNPGNVLRPGQYARIRAVIKTAKGALLVPQRAVTEQQGSYQVAVVTSGNTIEIRPVGVADRVGTQWIIENGLKPGERVVAEGIQKVRPGAIVNPKPLGVPAQLKAEPTAKSESR